MPTLMGNLKCIDKKDTRNLCKIRKISLLFRSFINVKSDYKQKDR